MMANPSEKREASCVILRQCEGECMTRLLSFIVLILLMVPSAHSTLTVRNEAHRYWLLRDNQYVDDVMREREKAFYLNVKGSISDGFLDFAGDMGDALDASDDAAALSLIQQNTNQEKNLNAHVELGIPLHFGAWEFGGSKEKPAVRFSPQIKASVETGASMAITEGEATGITNTSPECQLIRDFLGDPTFDCNAQLGNDPFINIYAQMTMKVGLNLDFEIGDHWEFTTWIYQMSRQDRGIAKTATQIVAEEDLIDFDATDNESSTINADVRLGYRNKDLIAFIAARELKVSGDFENEDTGLAVIYGDNPMYHAHAQYMWRPLSWLHFKPFLGAHKRDSYEWSEGWYAGSDLLFTTEGEWFQLGGTVKVDNFFTTIAPRIRMFDFLELAAYIKAPVQDEIDGIKQANIFGGNLRLRFEW
jgi:hypothetical protein